MESTLLGDQFVWTLYPNNAFDLVWLMEPAGIIFEGDTDTDGPSGPALKFVQSLYVQEACRGAL